MSGRLWGNRAFSHALRSARHRSGWSASQAKSGDAVRRAEREDREHVTALRCDR
jgi:hypothetical protein